MLNLTALLSARPAPVKHGRLVKGHAMSGSKDSVVTTTVAEPLPKRVPKLKTAKPVATRKQDLFVRYRSAMHGRGWMTTKAVAAFAGTSEGSAMDALSGLRLKGLIEARKAPKDNAPGFRWEWRWL